MSSFDLISFLKQSSIIQGSPKSTLNKKTTDGRIELYGNFAERSRKEINYHLFNGTDIPAIRNTMVAGVVGEKINIQARTDFPKINKQFESLLKDHSKIRNFEITSRFSRNEALRQIVGMEVINGGVIVRHHYNTLWDIPYKVELVGVDMIDTSRNNLLDNTLNGMVLDKYGTTVGLYLFDDYAKTKSSFYSTKDITIYTPVWMSLSQYTAVSRVVSILSTLDDSILYRNQELKAAIERAKSGVYWHTELFDVLQDALNSSLKDLPLNEQVLQAKDIMEKASQRGVGISGSVPTPKDDKITQLDNKTDTVYETLTNESQKTIASAVGGSQVSIYRDIAKGNYSSIKAAISFDEEHYKIEFDRLVSSVIDEYLERLFTVGVQTGKIDLARSKYFNNISRYHEWDVLRTSKRVIDEAKEATAISKRLDSGTTTKGRVFAEKGLDYATEMEKQLKIDIEIEIKKREAYKKAGLNYSTKEKK